MSEATRSSDATRANEEENLRQFNAYGMLAAAPSACRSIRQPRLVSMGGISTKRSPRQLHSGLTRNRQVTRRAKISTDMSACHQ
jgi:hypothetical protein